MNKKEDIKVIVVNEPDKKECRKKTKELCEFLEKTWHLPIKAQ